MWWWSLWWGKLVGWLVGGLGKVGTDSQPLPPPLFFCGPSICSLSCDGNRDAPCVLGITRPPDAGKGDTSHGTPGGEERKDLWG